MLSDNYEFENAACSAACACAAATCAASSGLCSCTWLIFPAEDLQSKMEFSFSVDMKIPLAERTKSLHSCMVLYPSILVR